MNELELKVALFDGNGQIIHSQDYNEYAYGARDWRMTLPIYGRRLANILLDDTGTIRFDENKIVLAHIITLDPMTSAMNLLGKIAEAVIVRKCADNPRSNRKWLQIARRRGTQQRTANQFLAIGTGLNATRKKYPRRYNPGDPQRDIIWIDKDEMPALMNGGGQKSGIEAGLQIKVSTDGVRYILNDLLERRYEIPLIYFPLKNDFERIVDTLSRKTIYDPVIDEERPVRVGVDFFDVRAIDIDVFEEVQSYFPLVYALINGELTPEDLIYESRWDTLLQNAIMATALHTKPNTNSLIIET